MNREKIIDILGILKVAYPRFYANMTKDEAEKTINLWCEMFKNDPPELVAIAVKKLITELQYPPTIADIKNTMYKLVDRIEDNTELWNKFIKALKNSGYNSKEEYEKLPEIVQKFVGSHERLRDYAMMDLDTINTVVKGQFLKQIDSLKIRQRENAMLSEEVKNVIMSLSNRMDVKQLKEN